MPSAFLPTSVLFTCYQPLAQIVRCLERLRLVSDLTFLISSSDKKFIAVGYIDGVEEILNGESHPIKKLLATGGRHRDKNTFALSNGMLGSTALPEQFSETVPAFHLELHRLRPQHICKSPDKA